MSKWIKKNTPEHKEVMDMRTGMHIIPLIHEESGAEHKLQIFLGPNGCPCCGHIPSKTETGHIDVTKHLAETIAMLEDNHANQREHAKKHRVPIRKAKP